jgi:glycosyltransferase involved in cell wall biosynthesis
MKAAVYNPYLDSLGGGERYTSSFAKVLKEIGYSVDMQWKDTSIKDKLEKRFGLDLSGINRTPDIKRGDAYDLCFWLSDGSIPLLRARKNILHFQFPFKDVGGKSLLNKMKLFRVSKIVCNSYFTKGFIDKEYGVSSDVIYPPVDVDLIKPKRKENIILYVGRFSQLEQAKNQHVLIQAFKSFYKRGYNDWKLILAGGVEVGVGDYIKKLEKNARGYPINIIRSPKLDSLKSLYGKAKFFWSAVGFGVNEDKQPQKVEHFGISLVEAMSAGSTVVAYNAGGYKEIIADGRNGYLWNKKSQLVNKTIDLIGSKSLMNKISKKAQIDSKIYEYERFATQVEEIIIIIFIL